MNVRMFVEIPAYSLIKYEFDKECELFYADRLLDFPYPAAYGFIPSTIADDQDPLDVFLIGEAGQIVTQGSVLNLEVVGMIKFIDNGEIDHKILAKFEKSTVNLPSTIMDLEFFLSNYKTTPVEVQEFVDKEEAEEYIKLCRRRYEGINS